MDWIYPPKCHLRLLCRCPGSAPSSGAAWGRAGTDGARGKLLWADPRCRGRLWCNLSGESLYGWSHPGCPDRWERVLQLCRAPRCGTLRAPGGARDWGQHEQWRKPGSLSLRSSSGGKPRQQIPRSAATRVPCASPLLSSRGLTGRAGGSAAPTQRGGCCCGTRQQRDPRAAAAIPQEEQGTPFAVQ